MADDALPRDDLDAQRRARRRRRLDEVFGEVVPDVTRDESSDDGAGLRPRGPADPSDDRDDEIKRDVPPHHT
jgi:hypothetical protein